MPKKPSGNFDERKYISEYQKLNYDRIGILLPKGSRSILNQIAAENGISTSHLVISAIEKQYNISLKKEK